jgi:hypothetical protein
MVALAMRGGCGFVGVRGLIVELGGSVVWALRHSDFLLSGLDAEIVLSAHPPAIDSENRAGHVVARVSSRISRPQPGSKIETVTESARKYLEVVREFQKNKVA